MTASSLGKTVIQIYATVEFRQILEAIALKERRPLSSMALMLLEEAVDLRTAKDERKVKAAAS